MSDFRRVGSQVVAEELVEAVSAPDAANESMRERLTPKELDVLARVVTGQTLQQIAETLGVSRNTVHFHVKNIYGKLGVSTRVEAALRAARLGLIAL